VEHFGTVSIVKIFNHLEKFAVTIPYLLSDTSPMFLQSLKTSLRPGCYIFKNYLFMATRGSKVERNSVSNQPHEIKYEARKTGSSAAEIKDTKQSAGNQRSKIEKEIKGKK